MEEVRRQMAESMPGTMDVFAESYAEMTGSGLVGQEALAKFYEDISKGNIESAKILPIVARILSERAAPKIDIMKKSSIAEQARSQNMQTQMLESFSKAGGETGFARLWRTATDAMREMDRVMPNIGQIFDKGTYFFRQLILLPQSIGRMFDGRDSNFQKWLFGQGETGETIMQMMFNIRDILKEVGELGGKSYEGWKMLFDLFKDSGALQTVLNTLKEIQTSLLLTLQSMNKLTSGDFSGAGEALKQALSIGLRNSPAGMLGRGLGYDPLATTAKQGLEPFDQEQVKRSALNNPSSVRYGWTPEMYDENAKNMAQESMMQRNMDAYGTRLPGVMKVEVKLDANITAEKSEDVANTFVKMLDDKLQQTLTSYGYSGAQ